MSANTKQNVPRRRGSANRLRRISKIDMHEKAPVLKKTEDESAKMNVETELIIPSAASSPDEATAAWTETVVWKTSDGLVEEAEQIVKRLSSYPEKSDVASMDLEDIKAMVKRAETIDISLRAAASRRYAPYDEKDLPMPVRVTVDGDKLVIDSVWFLPSKDSMTRASRTKDVTQAYSLNRYLKEELRRLKQYNPSVVDELREKLGQKKGVILIQSYPEDIGAKFYKNGEHKQRLLDIDNQEYSRFINEIFCVFLGASDNPHHLTSMAFITKAVGSMAECGTKMIVCPIKIFPDLVRQEFE